jgi:hypothetical protein
MMLRNWNRGCLPFASTKQDDQIIVKLERHTTSATNRWAEAAAPTYPSQRPFLTPPNFAPNGRDPPAERLVGMAVSR